MEQTSPDRDKPNDREDADRMERAGARPAPAASVPAASAPEVQTAAASNDDAPPAAAADPSAELAARIEEMAPPDAAMLLANLEPDRAAAVVEYLDPQTAGRALTDMDAAVAAVVVSAMRAPEASMVLGAMHPDDRVDILDYCAPGVHDSVVSEMEASDAAEVRQLEQFPPDTAGGIMTTAVTALNEQLSVVQAIDELRRLSEELEQMFYVYVVDDRKHLVGVLSMRDLILAPPDRRLRNIMRSNVTSVPATMDQEQVAHMVRRLGYLALPVVDERGRLIGLITVDDVVDVVEEEATEDVQKMFGAGAEERLTSPWVFSFRKRVWWLLVNLATAFLAAGVVGLFQGTIQRLAILAAYMPIVAGMGGNASAQAMAVSIRGLAMGSVDRALLHRVLYREFLVGALTGIVVGVVTAVVAIATHHEHGNALGGVVAAALIINHILACTSGAAIPFAMKGLGFDPAQSSSIFATTVTDVAGFFALLGLAWACMPWLMG